MYKRQFKTYTNERKASFVKALLEENEEAADSILSDILMKTISYYDNNEAFYHGLLMGLLSDYIVESNKEIGEMCIRDSSYPFLMVFFHEIDGS